jgi:hypothetical protein
MVFMNTIVHLMFGPMSAIGGIPPLANRLVASRSMAINIRLSWLSGLGQSRDSNPMGS